MRKLILTNRQSPGDIVMLTAAVRDLHKSHPGRFATDVRTTAPELWAHNPYITKLDAKDPDVETIKCQYPLISRSNQSPYHFIHGFRKDLAGKLGVRIPQGAFHGDVHLSAEESGWMGQVEEGGHRGDFWIIVAGGKFDFTAKWWSPQYYQEVVDRLRGRVRFVQCGESKHWHPPLEGVINLVGKTDIRQFVRLMYHAAGVVCPVTLAMHLAAAVPVPPGRPKRRPCVVIAGGREPTHWEAYPHHQFLHTVGALACCETGGCWRSRCQTVGDGSPKDTKKLCEQPVELGGGVRIPKCMFMIKPADVVRAVEVYFRGGAGRRRVTLTAAKEICFLGMKRSGNHPALDWIVSQTAGRVCFLNNVARNEPARTRMTSGLPSLPRRVRIREMEGKALGLVVYSYEDMKPAEALWQAGVAGDRRWRVLILRDPYNLLASTVGMGCQAGQWAITHRPQETTPRPRPEALNAWVERWKEHAREFQRMRDNPAPGEVAFNYNCWTADPVYRDALADRLDLDNRSDGSMKAVPGYGLGSSFDGRRLDGRADQGKYHERWRMYADEAWFREVFQDDELVRLSEEIFGEIPGTEELNPVAGQLQEAC